MKKLFSKILCLLLTIAFAFSAFACSSLEDALNNALDNQSEKVDSTKTQIYVGLVKENGYGYSWLNLAKARFEEKYKDVSFESGKKGVQVMIQDSGYGNVIENKLSSAQYSVIYTSVVDIYALHKAGKVYDMKDIINNDISVEDVNGNTITEKGFSNILTPNQLDYYTFDNGIYALPFVTTDTGIAYDRELFEEKGLFFLASNQDATNYKYPNDTPPTEGNFTREDYLAAKNGTSYRFGKSSGKVLSMGRDGIPGTFDDGLPATFEQFFALMDKMLNLTQIEPITWSGKYVEYLLDLAYGLWVDIAGVDEMSAFYNLGGEITVMNAVENNGNLVSYTSNKITIDKNSAYRIHETVSKYQALVFIDEMLKKLSQNSDYFNDAFTSQSNSNIDAQNRFLESKYDYNQGNRNYRVAMFYDGVYWENEARDTFLKYNENGKLSRQIGWMPYPHPTTEGAGASTVVNGQSTLCFVNNNIKGNALKEKLANIFVKFMHTNESLVEFTQETSMIQPFNFNLSAQDRTKMSFYGQNVYDKFIASVNNGTFFYPMANTAEYRTHFSVFNIIRNSFATNKYGDNPAVSFKQRITNTDTTTKSNPYQYFKNSLAFYSATWADSIK